MGGFLSSQGDAVTLQQLPLYGRKYQLKIIFPPDAKGNFQTLTVTDSDFEPEALRMTFDVWTAGWNAYWYADIVIYNLDQMTQDQLISGSPASIVPASASAIARGNPPPGTSANAKLWSIQQGTRVVLSAGYINGTFGVIWDGFVMQALFDRENVTDFKLTLHCVLGIDELTRNFVNSQFVRGLTQAGLVKQMADSCFRKIPIAPEPDGITDNLNKQPLPRGVTMFGSPADILDDIAEFNNASTWLSSAGISMASFDGKDVAVSSNDVLVYTPENGIIGTPQQTQYGIMVKLLLDSRVRVTRPWTQINIDNTVIQQLKLQLGQDVAAYTPLDSGGFYIVLRVRHTGDTRGQDWYTDIEGVTALHGKLAAILARQAASQ